VGGGAIRLFTARRSSGIDHPSCGSFPGFALIRGFGKTVMEDTMADFVPPAYPHEIELQNLVAVVECRSKERIPKQLQNLNRTKLVKDIQ
jgi:hypothetical protein